MTFSEMFHFPGRSSKNDKVIKIKSWIKDRCSKVFFFFLCSVPRRHSQKNTFLCRCISLEQLGYLSSDLQKL